MLCYLEKATIRTLKLFPVPFVLTPLTLVTIYSVPTTFMGASCRHVMYRIWVARKFLQMQKLITILLNKLIQSLFIA